MSDKVEMLIRVPRETRRALKIRAAERDLSGNALIALAIQAVLREPAPARPEHKEAA